jgi:hypothetical protein|tara:strand:- start:938 stop:1114 length:177 start_codon:yes stop_codon:yes gene_type:complete
MSRVTTYDVVDMREVYQIHCKHKITEYQAPEPENNVQEDNVCIDCGMSLHIPQIDDNI